MHATPQLSPTWQPLLSDLRTYLVYERDEGRDRITVSPVRQSARPAAAAAATATAAAPTIPTVPTAEPVSGRQPRKAGTAPAAAPLPRDLDAIAQRIAACTLCALARTRTNTVPGTGNPHPDLMFIGEAPGEDEDRQGLPFVGRSGALLTRMIENLGLSRETVFIANILKCRPPGNRTPTPRERDGCLPYLEAQIDTLKPKVIVALGATALRGLLPEHDVPISRSRGVWHSYRGIPLMPTYHPSYLLRTKQARFDTWSDMLQVLDRLGLPPPPPRPPGNPET